MQVVNLTANGQGVYGIKHDLEFYNNIDFEAAIIFNGYNDLDPVNVYESCYRCRDPIFKATGYKMILGLYLREKLNIRNKKKRQKQIYFDTHDEPSKDEISNFIADYDRHAQNIERSNGSAYKEYITYLDAIFSNLIQLNKRIIFMSPPGLGETLQQEKVQTLIRENIRLL